MNNLNWVEINQPSLPQQLPEDDEFVVWRTEEGNYFVREIDKDDFDWWNGSDVMRGVKCTHWARIIGPGGSKETEGLKEALTSILTNDSKYDLPVFGNNEMAETGRLSEMRKALETLIGKI